MRLAVNGLQVDERRAPLSAANPSAVPLIRVNEARWKSLVCIRTFFQEHTERVPSDARIEPHCPYPEVRVHSWNRLAEPNGPSGGEPARCGCSRSGACLPQWPVHRSLVRPSDLSAIILSAGGRSIDARSVGFSASRLFTIFAHDNRANFVFLFFFVRDA